MSRRVLAPVLLLLAAACSIAAVFAVHRIEARGGPLSQPSATTYFSPNGDDVQDTAEVRFTTRQPERVTVIVRDLDTGDQVTLADDQRVDGETTLEWDGRTRGGTQAPDGEYRFTIRRAGDSRAYAPTRSTVLDTSAPIGVLDRATLELGELRGLAMLGPTEKLVVYDAEGDEVRGIRQFRPNPASRSAQPVNAAPRSSVPVRFTVTLEGTPSRIDVVDLAGNRRPVFPDPDVQYQANG
ncbi:MAG: hypothetical protein JWL76_2054 [Thermoleophilia bacterium]|nr:hypothetical protein [Thermoleophilia bacterium]